MRCRDGRIIKKGKKDAFKGKHRNRILLYQIVKSRFTSELQNKNPVWSELDLKSWTPNEHSGWSSVHKQFVGLHKKLQRTVTGLPSCSFKVLENESTVQKHDAVFHVSFLQKEKTRCAFKIKMCKMWTSFWTVCVSSSLFYVCSMCWVIKYVQPKFSSLDSDSVSQKYFNHRSQRR